MVPPRIRVGKKTGGPRQEETRQDTIQEGGWEEPRPKPRQEPRRETTPETTPETTIIQGMTRNSEGHKVPDTNRADSYPKPKAVTSNNKTSRQSLGVKRPVGPPPSGKQTDSPTPPVELPVGKLSAPPGKLTGAPSSHEKRGPATPTNVTVANFDLYEDASRAKPKNTQKTAVGVRAQQKDQNQKEVR